MENSKIDRCYELAKLMRLDVLEMARKTGKAGAHLGGSFSSMDIIAVLYGAILQVILHYIDQE